MRTLPTHAVSCAPDLIDLVQVVWGYSELVRRGLALGEDVGELTAAIAAAGDRATRSTFAAVPA